MMAVMERMLLVADPEDPLIDCDAPLAYSICRSVLWMCVCVGGFF